MLSYSIIGSALIKYTTMALLFTLLVVVLMVFIWFGTTRDN